MTSLELVSGPENVAAGETVFATVRTVGTICSSDGFCAKEIKATVEDLNVIDPQNPIPEYGFVFDVQ